MEAFAGPLCRPPSLELIPVRPYASLHTRVREEEEEGAGSTEARSRSLSLPLCSCPSPHGYRLSCVFDFCIWLNAGVSRGALSVHPPCAPGPSFREFKYFTPAHSCVCARVCARAEKTARPTAASGEQGVVEKSRRGSSMNVRIQSWPPPLCPARKAKHGSQGRTRPRAAKREETLSARRAC